MGERVQISHVCERSQRAEGELARLKAEVRDALLTLEFAKAVEEADLVGARRVVHRLLSGDEQEGSHTEDEVGPTIWDSGDE